MSRLPSLFPHLFRSLRAAETCTLLPKNIPLRPPEPAQLKSAFHSSVALHDPTFAQSRHGSAVEPPPQFSDKPDATEQSARQMPEPPHIEGAPSHINSIAKQSNESLIRPTSPTSSKPSVFDTTIPQAAPSAPPSNSVIASAVSPSISTASTQDEKFLLGQPSQNPHHLSTPPYVHYFDTYTLVRDLESAGFREDQSVTAMKAVRGLLADNLKIAKESLVSKSDVENSIYLFRAACSELKTEIQNYRQIEADKIRAQRTHLQHEFDILNQRLTQDLLTLKDELKGMFDDRKMSVRMDQRETDSQIQMLNYKITVLLNSDAKSDIEGLRWVLVRRAAIAIVTMALLILSSIKYSSVVHERENESQLNGNPKSNEKETATFGKGGDIAVVQTIANLEGEGSIDAGGDSKSAGYVSLG
ncbi:MAG: hypothetical protein M1829_004414 [Trizodia sp. TS-e1964]|nr:MAG: hypothetical protein M1829_004414 [Trizodia sp. TS-e1964]